jgi:S1-C subfamily serine protease
MLAEIREPENRPHSFGGEAMRCLAPVCAILLIGLSALAQPTDPETIEVFTPREIVERAGPAVVMIQVESYGRTKQGSGFLVEGDGAIVTNLHVLDGASKLAVLLPDGNRIEEVAVRAFDVRRDLAVLVVDVPDGVVGLPTADFGDTSSIEPGEKVLVISNPLGLEQTVTEGIVSAWREPQEQEDDDPRDVPPAGLLLPQCRLIQISADISPGSSGGPVFNDRAEVIGVATAGILHGASGLNFAVPVDELSALLAEDEAMDLATFRKRADDVRLDLARPYFDDAEIAYERGERRVAKYHLERALQLFPRYEKALLLSGRMAMEEGQTKLAEQRFTDAVVANTDSAEAWYLLGTLHHLTALDDDDAASLSRAQSAYEKALDLDPRHGHAAYGLAGIKAGQGFIDRAEELLLVAVESEPGLTDARYALGEIYLSRGQMEDAKDAFEQALWEDENHALSHYGLARLYLETDRSPLGAVSSHGAGPHHWKEFLRLSEGDPSLAQQREIAILILQQYLPHLLEE